MIKYLAIFMSLVTITNSAFANDVIKQLDERMKQTDSLVCVGLDPDPTKMPLSMLKSTETIEESVFVFLSEIVDTTAPHVCCYKIQKAFFDQFDRGHAVLRKICAYIHETHPGIPVFIDCKIGDIDNTMQAYMHVIFDDIAADGVVINPYMGDDVLEPFIQDPKKVALVMIQTSNPKAKVIQELVLQNGKELWEEVLDISLTRWNENENLIAILSSNSFNDCTLIRKKIPQNMPILLAGIGSQGGNPRILKQLLNDDNRGVFVNSSRGILYPYAPTNEEWKSEVLKATIDLKEMLNKIRNEG